MSGELPSSTESSFSHWIQGLLQLEGLSLPETAHESPQEENIHDWWTKQVLIMFAGIFCGLVANAFLRRGSSVSLGNNALSFLSKLFKESKMVFLVRTDISMGKGKMASQVAHAAILCYQDALKKQCEHLGQWETSGQMKVVLKVPDETELRRLWEEAQRKGLPTALVRDAGRTQIERGTTTVVGIGPAPLELIDSITGHLKLF